MLHPLRLPLRTDLKLNLIERHQSMSGKNPVWDSKSGELSIGDFVVKQFRWPAANQALILKAFQRQKWKTEIKDPLPRASGINPKVRLHDTIKCLNRNHLYGIVRFHGNGDGTGVTFSVDGVGLAKAVSDKKRGKIRKKK